MALHLPCKGNLNQVTNTIFWGFGFLWFGFVFLSQAHMQFQKRSQGTRKGQSSKVETFPHIRDFSSW